jgi:hypothetical protein
MNKPAFLIPLLIIVNACIWGLTIVMTARALKGTGSYQEIQHLLGAGAGMSTVIVGGGLAGLAKAFRSN